MHFRDKHSLCEHSDCLNKKFVVFTSEAELKVCFSHSLFQLYPNCQCPCLHFFYWDSMDSVCFHVGFDQLYFKGYIFMKFFVV